MLEFTEAGVIGRSGRFYGCLASKHVKTMDNACEDAPFVELHTGDMAMFEAYYTCEHTQPTQAQFETLMNWCIVMEIRFEDVIDSQLSPWTRFLNTREFVWTLGDK